jgi:hypothetical protein
MCEVLDYRNFRESTDALLIMNERSISSNLYDHSQCLRAYEEERRFVGNRNHKGREWIVILTLKSE